MLLRSPLVRLAYLAVGFYLAHNDGYLSGIDDLQAVAEAMLAVALWPLLLFGVNLRF